MPYLCTRLAALGNLKARFHCTPHNLYIAKVIKLFEMRHKINNNYILGACLVVLIALCILSIRQPMRFQQEQERREQVVKERLLLIKKAEEKYKARHGVYAGDFKTLVKGKYLADSLQYIPFSGGKKFSLTATTIVGKSGKQIPLMECGATYEDYLDGLNENNIQEVTEQANGTGLFPGLKIGDITIDNDNAGNW